jgi:hypothetical protein
MRILRAFRQLRDDTAGNTLAICAAAIFPLTAVIGSALDMSVAYMTRARLQNACDAGVLAGRQFMTGKDFKQSVRQEARKFFDFNFPEGTSGATGIDFTVEQDKKDGTQLIGVAEAAVPTSLMRIFGFDEIPLEVSCDAKRDMGHNDIVLVLDVTGSMADPPSSGSGTKIGRLRTGTIGLYRALDNDDGSLTRYGIVPYSHTVNVGGSLMNKDILRVQEYVDRTWNWGTGSWDWSTKDVHVNDSSWNNGNDDDIDGETGNTQGFRTSGNACIEERPSIGSGHDPVRYETTIAREDIDTQAGNAGKEPELQFGRYDPAVQEGEDQSGCPSEASRLAPYDTESAYQAAIGAATARVTGGTYHDIGMLWGLRFISRTGYFKGKNLKQGDNITEIDGIPVNQHIIFMTDGRLDVDEVDDTHDLYSAYGIERRQGRMRGSGTMRSRHISRFGSACSLAKSMGVTVWVIALDVTDTEDIEPCATSADHFYTSDGADLEQVFQEIGQGIGNLRLTR